MAKLKIYGQEYIGATRIEIIKAARNGCEKLADAMSYYLSEYDNFDEDGEYIPAEYTNDQIEESFDRATGNNPSVFRIKWFD